MSAYLDRPLRTERQALADMIGDAERAGNVMRAAMLRARLHPALYERTTQ